MRLIGFGAAVVAIGMTAALGGSADVEQTTIQPIELGQALDVPLFEIAIESVAVRDEVEGAFKEDDANRFVVADITALNATGTTVPTSRSRRSLRAPERL